MAFSYDDILKTFLHTETMHDYTLEKMRHACAFFGHPEKQFTSIHIAGTNGKGSVSKMVFQVLKESGKRVGVYTSPHYTSIRERFETEAGLISEEDFCRHAMRVIEYGHGLSYFERCVMVAFLHFAEMQCEYAVIEVGMGGRLDATNVITPVITAITSISFDHMQFLGDTLESISTEKGGIIKSGVPLVLYGSNPTIEALALERNAPVLSPVNFALKTNLSGEHQERNAQIAYRICEYVGISDTEIREALLHVNHPGRLQFLRTNVLYDGAHNIEGLLSLHDFMDGEKKKWKHVEYHMNYKEGKSFSLFRESFPDIKEWYVVDADAYHLSPAKEVVQEIQDVGYSAQIRTPEEIFRLAENNPETLYLVFGSLYMLTPFLLP